MLCFAVVILLIYDLNELFIHNVQGYFTGAWVATLFSTDWAYSLSVSECAITDSGNDVSLVGSKPSQMPCWLIVLL